MRCIFNHVEMRRKTSQRRRHVGDYTLCQKPWVATSPTAAAQRRWILVATMPPGCACGPIHSKFYATASSTTGAGTDKRY